MKYILLLLILAGCSKTKFAPAPTCKRVYELCDRYTRDTVFIRTDTIWPWGRYNNWFCGKDTLQFINHITAGTICADSTYQVTRYAMN